jgi:hypothetical protein
MGRLAMVLWAVVAVAWAAPVRADAPTPQARFEVLVEEARSAVTRKDYALCEQRFRAAWVIHPDPVLLLNAATCLEKAGEVEATRRVLVDLLATAPPDEIRAEVRAWIVRLPAAPEPSSTPTLRAPADGGTLRASPAMPPREIAAWTATIGGAALALGGATLLGLAAMDVDTVNSASVDPTTGFVDEMTRTEALALDASAQLKSGVGVGLLAVGGAALVAGIVLFVIDGDGGAPPSVGVSPTLGGLRVTGSF